ncbi:MAG: hypothetical protein ACFCUU_02975 [Cyclobacteriaceae bacterium]
MRKLLMSLIAMGIFSAQAQDASDDATEVATNYVLRYFAPSFGFLNANYRDFATSPLFYEGPGIHIGLSWLWESARWENALETDFNFSAANAVAPESSYFEFTTTSIFLNNQVYNHYLRKIDQLSSERFDVKLGGAFISNFNARINSELQNAAAGIEVLANLMLAGKIETDVSRTESKTQKIWFIRYTLRPEERRLSFQLNTGLLNMNWRPGYAYLSDSEFNGSETGGLGYLLAGHRWSMNGWRFGTRLEYTKYKTNGNGTKLSYLWDVAHVPGRHEAFQMASHTFKYTLLINTNK